MAGGFSLASCNDVPVPTSGALVSIAGQVFNDIDEDAIHGLGGDSEEDGLGGTAVSLYDMQGNLVASKTTDEAGRYDFSFLAPGVYVVGQEPLPGWKLTTPGGHELRDLATHPSTGAAYGIGNNTLYQIEPVTGVINYLLESVGLPEGTWHTSTDTALFAVMIADIWQWTPFVALILLAGMQSISPEIVEAARLDRVRGWAYIRRIVLPLIWPVVTVVLLLRLVDSIRVFDLIYIITRGGPGTATLVASVYDFTIFQAGRLWTATHTSSCSSSERSSRTPTGPSGNTPRSTLSR